MSRQDLTESTGIDQAIGAALRDLRESRGLTARELAGGSGVSAAMISRIENGQVSPSLATLEALSQALEVPVVSLFRETANRHADFTHVRNGEGIRSTRIMDDHSHEFVNLAIHTRRDLQFETYKVTLERQSAQPPTYVDHGVVFIHILEGSAVYRYGDTDITLEQGDSLSLDAELRHGFRKLLTDEITFLSVEASARTRRKHE